MTGEYTNFFFFFTIYWPVPISSSIHLVYILCYLSSNSHLRHGPVLISSHPPYPYHILQSTRPFNFPSSFRFDFLYSFASYRGRDNDIDHRVPLLPSWEASYSRSTPQQGNQSRITKVQSFIFFLFSLFPIWNRVAVERRRGSAIVFFFTTKRGFPRLRVIIAGDGNHLWGYRLSESLQVSTWLFRPFFYPFFMFLFFGYSLEFWDYFISLPEEFTRNPLQANTCEGS